MIRAVIFDLDDTLYPERDFVLSGFRAAAHHAAALTGLPERRWLGAMLAAFRQDTRGVFDRAVAALAPARPGLVAELVATYREHPPTLNLPVGSEAALRRAARLGPLGLVSDGLPAQQRRKLAALGLTDRFTALILTGELGPGQGKPSPKPFEAALAALGVDAPAAVYISDNPLKDFRGPNLIGMPSVRVRRPRGVYARHEPAPGWEPTATVDSLDAALTWIEDYGSGSALGFESGSGTRT